jgi:hypothetical protein
VVAGHDRHTGRVESEIVLDDVSGQVELGLERQVGEVPRDDDVIHAGPRDLPRDGADVLRPVNAGALQAQVGEAGQALVEKAPGRDAVEREQV